MSRLWKVLSAQDINCHDCCPGEYGEEWHRQGMRHNKQNVFDDFAAAGEWLIKNQYTSRDYLTINGRSNGGLLVGTSSNQRPDIFGASLANVG